ncbi:unnamed protein product, partial [Cladocopium goreaui]
ASDKDSLKEASQESETDGEASKARAIAAFVTSAAFHSVMSLCVKLASGTFPTAQILWARYTVQMLVTSLMLWKKRPNLNLPRGLKILLLLRGLLGMSSQGCHMLSLKMLPLPDAVSLHTVYPVFTALLAPFTLGEPLSAAAVCAALCATVGCSFIAQGRLSRAPPKGQQVRLGMGIALLGALNASLTYLLVRKLMRKSERAIDPEVVVWSYSLTALCVLILALPLTASSFVWDASASAWLALISVGATSVIEQLLVTLGFRGLSATAGTLMLTLEAAFAFVFSALILKETPRLQTLLGAALVAAAVTVSTLRKPGCHPRYAAVKSDVEKSPAIQSESLELENCDERNTGPPCVKNGDH